MGESDRTYCEHARYSMNHMGDYIQKNIVDIAQKAGINTNGKYYEGAIGRYNDPLAWVSGVDDAKAAIKKKNYTCEGLVRNKAVSAPHKEKEIVLGEDIVRSSMQEHISAIRQEKGTNWKPSRKKLGELREMVIERHGKRRRKASGISSGESFSRRVSSQG